MAFVKKGIIILFAKYVIIDSNSLNTAMKLNNLTKIKHFSRQRQIDLFFICFISSKELRLIRVASSFISRNTSKPQNIRKI